MTRKTYVIEAENGVGIYLSYNLAVQNFERLSSFDRVILPFYTYEEAVVYIQKQYKNDTEMDIAKLYPNSLVMRNVSERWNFYIQSPQILGYGIDRGMAYAFKSVLPLSDRNIIEVESTWSAEYYARRGFVKEYGDSRLYYSGSLCPGETISLEEMAQFANILLPYEPNLPKFHGISQSY